MISVTSQTYVVFLFGIIGCYDSLCAVLNAGLYEMGHVPIIDEMCVFISRLDSYEKGRRNVKYCTVIGGLWNWDALNHSSMICRS